MLYLPPTKRFSPEVNCLMTKRNVSSKPLLKHTLLAVKKLKRNTVEKVR